MVTNGHEPEPGLLHRDLVYRLVGCAREMIKELGHGWHEKPDEHAWVLAFQDAGIAHRRQASCPMLFKGRPVGEYVPDHIVDDAVVVDTKVLDRITDHERGQMLNYLRITKLRVGLLLNFERAKLEWERLAL